MVKSDIMVVWVILILGSLIGNVVVYFQEKHSRKKFDRDVKRLMRIAIDACACTGSIKLELPEYKGSTAWDAETGMEVFIFKEYNDSDQIREIYVSRNGRNVWATPWR